MGTGGLGLLRRVALIEVRLARDQVRRGHGRDDIMMRHGLVGLVDGGHGIVLRALVCAVIDGFLKVKRGHRIRKSPLAGDVLGGGLLLDELLQCGSDHGGVHGMDTTRIEDETAQISQGSIAPGRVPLRIQGRHVLRLLVLRREFVFREIDAGRPFVAAVGPGGLIVDAQRILSRLKTGDLEHFLIEVLHERHEMQRRLCRRIDGIRQRLLQRGEGNAAILRLDRADRGIVLGGDRSRRIQHDFRDEIGHALRLEKGVGHDEMAHGSGMHAIRADEGELRVVLLVIARHRRHQRAEIDQAAARFRRKLAIMNGQHGKGVVDGGIGGFVQLQRLVDRRRNEDRDLDAGLLECVDQLLHRLVVQIEMGLAIRQVFRVGIGHDIERKSDIVRAHHDRDGGGLVREDIPIEPHPPAGGGVARNAGVVQGKRPVREARRVIEKNVAVIDAAARDAVAEGHPSRAGGKRFRGGLALGHERRAKKGEECNEARGGGDAKER